MATGPAPSAALTTSAASQAFERAVFTAGALTDDELTPQNDDGHGEVAGDGIVPQVDTAVSSVCSSLLTPQQCVAVIAEELSAAPRLQTRMCEPAIGVASSGAAVAPYVAAACERALPGTRYAKAHTGRLGAAALRPNGEVPAMLTNSSDGGLSLSTITILVIMATCLFATAVMYGLHMFWQRRATSVGMPHGALATGIGAKT